MVMRHVTHSDSQPGYGPFWVLEEKPQGLVWDFFSEYKFFMQHVHKTPYQGAINCFMHWVMDQNHGSDMIAHIDCDENGLLTNLVHFRFK